MARRNELTRRELSEMIYFSENAIRGWETGIPPSYDAMIAVADCMGFRSTG
ncbi:MAG: helix-turn-helix domain-containing protein [Hydrogeniiclostridium mannosilyticum]